jgi:hypothetical protein
MTTPTITWNNPETEEDVVLAAHFEVCPRCQGRGVHDAWEGGMTQDEMDEQGAEFLDDYLGGVYDVTCSVCDGLRVVAEVDRSRCSLDELAAYDGWLKDEAEWLHEVAAEQRMGA